MKKRFLLLVILCILVLSAIIFVLTINYVDPYVNRVIGIISILTSFILGVSSFVCIALYFIKKIALRGNVSVTHVLASFRQGIMCSVYCIGLIFFAAHNAPLFISGALFLFFFLFLELGIQNLD